MTRITSRDLINLGLINNNWSIPNYNELNHIENRNVINISLIYINRYIDNLETRYNLIPKWKTNFEYAVISIIIGYLEKYNKNIPDIEDKIQIEKNENIRRIEIKEEKKEYENEIIKIEKINETHIKFPKEPEYEINTESNNDYQMYVLEKEMYKIDNIISNILPIIPNHTNHDLERILLNVVDLAPRSKYRKECASKINKLMDVIEKIYELKTSIESKVD